MTSRLLTAALALLVALLAPAAADAATTVGLDLSFTSSDVNAPTGGSLELTIGDAAAPYGKPAPVRAIQLGLPIGSTFDTGALEQCTATVAELFALPDSACPAGSQIGEGSAEAITGEGAGVDPEVESLTVYNGPNVLLISGRPAGSYGYYFAMQVNIGGSVVFFTLPVFCLPPGTAPDCMYGEATLSKLHITLRETTNGVRSYLRTPDTCTSAGWLSRATFSFDDDSTLVATKPLGCTVPPIPPPPPPLVRCVVPKLVGRTLAAAKLALRRSQCSVGKVTRKPSRRLRSGRVISSHPRAGTRLRKGARVSLLVSR